MQKLHLALALTLTLALHAGAITITNNTPITKEVEWTITHNLQAQTTTFYTKIVGNYDFTLGWASITAQSGGSITVVTTNTNWANSYGIGLVSNTNPYDMQGKTGQHMSVYIGHPTEHATPRCIEYYVNNYRYRFDGEDEVGTHANGTVITTETPTTAYSQRARTLYDNSPNLNFGYTMGAAWETDEEGNQTLAGLSFHTPKTFEAPDGNTYELDAWINNETNTAVLPNMGKSFDLTRLTSYGIASDDATYGISNDAITYVIITKPLVPEPTTATMSLLGLTALAMRRRRR